MLHTQSRVECSFYREQRLEREVDCYLILVPGIKYVDPCVHSAIRLDIAWCLTCLLLSPQPRVSRITSRRIRWAAQVDWIENKEMHIKPLFNSVS